MKDHSETPSASAPAATVPVVEAEACANARLIAAAPELLEACREIADHLFEKQDYARCRELARLAIAKVEGRKS